MPKENEDKLHQIQKLRLKQIKLKYFIILIISLPLFLIPPLFISCTGADAVFVPGLTSPGEGPNDPPSNFDGGCKAIPTVGTGNGSGYNGLWFAGSTYSAVDPEIDCHSEVLGETHITSMLTLTPDGKYIRSEGCNQVDPVEVAEKDLLKLDDPIAESEFIRLPIQDSNYELIADEVCIRKPILKDKIDLICKFENSLNFSDFILDNQLNYYISEMIVAVKSVADNIDRETGASVYSANISYVTMNREMPVKSEQISLPEMKLRTKGSYLFYSKNLNASVDDKLSGDVSRPFALNFEVHSAANTRTVPSSTLLLEYKNFTKQSMKALKCEWK